jgi:hypothetical protein
VQAVTHTKKQYTDTEGRNYVQRAGRYSKKEKATFLEIGDSSPWTSLATQFTSHKEGLCLHGKG